MAKDGFRGAGMIKCSKIDSGDDCTQLCDHAKYQSHTFILLTFLLMYN